MKTFTDILKEMDPEAALIRADVDMLQIMWELAEEECGRLTGIERAAKELYEDKRNTPVDQIIWDEDITLWINLGTALYGENDPRVKELKNG